MRNHPQTPASVAAHVKARESTIAALFFRAGEYTLRAEQAPPYAQRAQALENTAHALQSALPKNTPLFW